MKLNVIYRIIAGIYDWIDIIYFRNYERSPRKAVLELISGKEKILDLCTGTATNAIGIAKKRPNTQVVGVDLSESMLKVAEDTTFVVFANPLFGAKILSQVFEKRFSCLFYELWFEGEKTGTL